MNRDGTALVRVLCGEVLKLKGTLAAWLVLVAPGAVVSLQVMLFLNRREGWDTDLDLWKYFANSALSIWAIFMQPLLAALISAFVYGFEHTTNGWIKLYVMPVPRWTIPAAKHLIAGILLLAGNLFLVAGIVAGGFILGALHPAIEMPARIPILTILARAGLVFAGSIAILAIQNWAGMRCRTVTVPIGLGIVATFFALFAAGWRYGHLYPWLIPIRVLHGEQPKAAIALLVGLPGGLGLMVASVLDSLRRDIP